VFVPPALGAGEETCNVLELEKIYGTSWCYVVMARTPPGNSRKKTFLSCKCNKKTLWLSTDQSLLITKSSANHFIKSERFAARNEFVFVIQ